MDACKLWVPRQRGDSLVLLPIGVMSPLCVEALGRPVLRRSPRQGCESLVQGRKPPVQGRDSPVQGRECTRVLYRSWMHNTEEDYGRLEFLGDAVLGLVVTTYIFYSLGAHVTKGMDPGQLSDLRSSIVKNDCLAIMACVHGLDRFLLHSSPSLFDAIQSFKRVRPPPSVRAMCGPKWRLWPLYRPSEQHCADLQTFRATDNDRFVCVQSFKKARPPRAAIVHTFRATERDRFVCVPAR